MNLENNLARLRSARGLSAAQLAVAIGISRQTIYSIESGTYLPNTAVALKLAAALDVTVEQIFSLTQDAAPLPAQHAELLQGSRGAIAGQPVRLCRVNGKLIAAAPELSTWSLPLSDAVVTVAATGGKRPAKTTVELFENTRDFEKNLLIAGCDPGISVLARHLQRQDVDLVVEHRNSLGALQLLRDGLIHIAGCHIRDEKTGESNLPAIRQLFRKHDVAVLSFALWEEGLVIAKGNPRKIRGIADIAHAGVSIVNRDPGAGSRMLLDAHLHELGIHSHDVMGYDRIADGHLPAARRVQSGEADCCLATAAVARLLGLDFIPLKGVRYDLVVRKTHLQLPQVQALFNTVARAGFRRELECLGGYDTTQTGQRLM
jgi:putative molybdopterin biosynthesis protein